MKFCDKVKELRQEKKLTQNELAKLAGVSPRTIFGYEAGTQYPRKRETYYKLAEILGTKPNYLMTEDEAFEAEAYAKYGARGREQAQKLTEQMVALCAGGELEEEDMEAMVRAVQDAYWQVKEINRKHTPKKYLKKEEDADNKK